ncbi:MAG: hypothetical protein V8R63_11750 [Thomasclavelia ramosa]
MSLETFASTKYDYQGKIQLKQHVIKEKNNEIDEIIEKYVCNQMAMIIELGFSLNRRGYNGI